MNARQSHLTRANTRFAQMSVVLLATNNCSSSCKGLSKAKGKRKLPAVAEESDGESENEEMDERESGSERDDDADDSDDDRPLGQKQFSENWVEFDNLPTLPIVAVWDGKKRKVNFAGFTHQDKDGQQCGVWFGPTTSTSRKALELRKFCPSWTDPRRVEVFSWQQKPNHELTWATWSKDDELLKGERFRFIDKKTNSIPAEFIAKINAATCERTGDNEATHAKRRRGK